MMFVMHVLFLQRHNINDELPRVDRSFQGRLKDLPVYMHR